MRVIFPGSFDPITRGHLQVIARLLALADEVIVAIGVHPDKHGLFTPRERRQFIEELFPEEPRVRVIIEDGLMAQAARREGAVIVRALRTSADLAQEGPMAEINRRLGAETFFLQADPAFAHLSSSAVKELARYGANLAGMVTENVARALREKYPQAVYDPHKIPSL